MIETLTISGVISLLSILHNKFINNINKFEAILFLAIFLKLNENFLQTLKSFFQIQLIVCR
jgi:hypothetical protein